MECDASEQSEGSRATEPRLHDGGHRYCSRDVLALHRPTWPDERIPSPRAQRAKRCPQVALFPLRVHWRDGQGLHLLGHLPPRRRSHGSVNNKMVWSLFELKLNETLFILCAVTWSIEFLKQNNEKHHFRSPIKLWRYRIVNIKPYPEL